MKIGLMMPQPVPGNLPTPSTVADQIVRAEELGVHTVWVPNVRTSDALTILAVAATRTTVIELGTFVVPTYPRHPAALAQQALTVNALANGRLALGIGLSHRVVMETALGFDWDHPIRHLREYLACLQPLLRGEATVFQGEEYRLDGYALAIPGATPPQLLVAALGPQMLRLTGRLADGTAIWMGGPAYLRDHAVPVITEAASKAGRPAPRVVAGLPVCVTGRGAEARELANQAFGRYGELPSYRAILDKEGAGNVSDVALIGTADEVRAGIQALADAGATDLAASVFTLPDDDPTPTHDLLREYALKG
jgi:5,10-methylenetetrahydromethanopterin reductase